MIEILLEIINEANDQLDQCSAMSACLIAVNSDLSDIDKKIEEHHISDTDTKNY